MGSKYTRIIKEHRREFCKENPSYGKVLNVYPEGSIAHARYESEIWGFREGYEKALDWVLSQMKV